jgi:hypothetical protein
MSALLGTIEELRKVPIFAVLSEAQLAEFSDPEQLGEDMGGEEMKVLLAELHEYAEVTQLVSERFA